MIVCYWYDPEEPDHASNKGFQEHPTEEKFLDWANEMVKYRPQVEIKAYSVWGSSQLVLEAVSTITKFRVVG